MAFAVKVVMRGFSAEQYDRLREIVGWLDTPPVGGISHVVWWEGEDAHGLDVWESEEAWQAFGQDRMGPAMAELGFSVQPEATFLTAHEVFVPRAVTITS